MEKTVTVIPATKNVVPDPFKRVGIYCRVSSSKKAQLRSLAAQASGLTRYVDGHPYWSLKDIFIDVAPGDDKGRDGYRRMLDSARQGLINLVLVKSSSRLGRDTAEVIRACRELSNLNCDVYFCDARSSFSQMGELVCTITAGFDQADNESRSKNVAWGIRQKLENGSSKIYDRPCFGYEHNEDGRLSIKEDEAAVVRKIFLLYLSGASILTIKRTLENDGIPAPRGGAVWAKKTIESILENSKYKGASLVHTSYISPGDEDHGVITEDEKGDRHVLIGASDDHPPIVSTDIFEDVQRMRLDRSNIDHDSEGKKFRKSTHYSSKRDAKEKEGESIKHTL